MRMSIILVGSLLVASSSFAGKKAKAAKSESSDTEQISNSESLNDDHMAIWTLVEKALVQRDRDAFDKSLSDLERNVHSSTEEKPIVKLVNAQGSEGWRNFDEVSSKAKSIFKLLKVCDSYLEENSLEDLQRTCVKKDFDGSDWHHPALPSDLSILSNSAYLNEESILKPFNEKVAELLALKKKKKTENEALEAKKEQEASQKQKAAALKAEKDPKTWSERACNSQKLIDISNDTIRREQAGAKHSGVVNQRALYGAGQTIELMQEHQAKQKAEYRRLSGKEWTPGQCE